MRKFFKFGSHKKKDLTKDRRNSLASIGSSGSQDTVVSSRWGSAFGLNVCSESNAYYQVDISDDSSLTKLHKACWLGNLDKVKKHINKAVVNSVDSQYRAPLHLATAQAYKDIILFLLEWNAQLNLRDLKGFTPVLKAVECGHIEIVELLLERGADSRDFEKNGNNGLHLAAARGQQTVVVTLIQKGANINALNKDGMTPLLVSTVYNQIEVTHLLIRHGASLDIPDNNHKTCLMYSCESGCLDHVRLFLHHGAEVTAKDIEGVTAEDIAKVSGHNECVKIIKEWRLAKDLQEKIPNIDHGPLKNLQLGFPATHDDDINSAGRGQSEVDLIATDNNSWNDDSIENKGTFQEGLLSGMNLVKVFQEINMLSSGVQNSELPYASAKNVEDLENHPVSSHVNPEVDGKIAVLHKTDESNDSANDTSSSNLSLCYENEREEMKLTQELNATDAKEEVRQQRHDIDLMAELGLSDISEITTTSLSKLSVNAKEQENDSDLEDFNNRDNPMPQENVIGELTDIFSNDAEIGKTINNEAIANVEETISFEVRNKISSDVLKPLSNQSNGSGVTENITPGNYQTNSSMPKERVSQMEWSNSDCNIGCDGMDMMLTACKPLDHSLEKPSSSSTCKLYGEKEESDADGALSSPFPKINDAHVYNSGLEPYDKQSNVYDNANNCLSPEHDFEQSAKRDGTLGRIGTMHEVEEMWESNPCMESSAPGVIKLTPLTTDNNASEALASKSEVENFNECVSQSSIKDCNILKHDEMVVDKSRIWDQIMIMIFGKLDTGSDTGSDSEMSQSTCVEDQLSKESCLKGSICQETSITDEHSNTLSLKGDERYHLLIRVLQDGGDSNRVVGIIQELKLLWRKEQDKCKALHHRMRRMKIEKGNAEERVHILSLENNSLENHLHQTMSEVETLKHLLVVENNQRLEAQLQLDRDKIQLNRLEEALTDNVLLKQEAELAVMSNQNELKSTQELFLQFQDYVTEKASKTCADACIQTMDSEFEDIHFNKQNTSQTCVNTDNDCEDISLKQTVEALQRHVEVLSTSVDDERKQRKKAEDDNHHLQTEVCNLKYKFAICSEESERRSKELKVVILERDKLIKQVEDLVQQNIKLSTIASVTEEKNNQLLSQLTDVNCKFEEVKLKVCLLEKEVNAEKSSENRIKLVLQTSENEKQKLKSEAIELQERFDSLQTDHVQDKLKLENTIKLKEALEEQVLHFQKKLEVMSSAIHEDQQKARKKMYEYNQNLMKSNAGLQTNVAALKNIIEELNQEIKLSSVENMSLSKKLEMMQSESENKSQETKNLEDKYSTTIEKLEKAHELIEACRAKETYYSGEIETLKRKHHSLQYIEEEISALKLHVMNANDHAANAENRVKYLAETVQKQLLTSCPVNPVESNISKLESKTTVGDEAAVTEQRVGAKVSVTPHLISEANEHPKASESQDLIADHMINSLQDNYRDIKTSLTSLSECLANAFPDKFYNTSAKLCSTNVEDIEISLLEMLGALERIKKMPQENKCTDTSSTEKESTLFFNKGTSLETIQEKVERLRRELYVEKLRRQQHDAYPAWPTKQPRESNVFVPHNSPWHENETQHIKNHWVAESQAETSLHLAYVTKLLEEKSREDNLLKHLHPRESECHPKYHCAVKNLHLEVCRLNDHLNDKALYQATLEEHYNLVHQLRYARKRIKAKLDKTKTYSRLLRQLPVVTSKNEEFHSSPNQDFAFSSEGGRHLDSWSTFHNMGYSKTWKTVFH